MRRSITRAILLTVGAAMAGLLFVGRLFAAPRYSGPPSDHFDGKQFFNFGRGNHGTLAFFKWMFTREPGHWPRWIENKTFPAPSARSEALRVTFINHATMLIQVDGLNILTDPIWSRRTSPVSWAGPARRRDPGVAFDALPKIDFVLLSHNHYDHLDLSTLERLEQRDHPVIISALGNVALLEKHSISGGRSHEWWETVEASTSVRIHLVPAQHFSGRGLTDRDANLWAGYVIESSKGRVFFAGDTGWGPHFQMIRDRIGTIDVALLPIGAFRPVWFMSPVHISPLEAVRAHRILGARISIPMHYGTFNLGDDGEAEPLLALRRALASEGLPESEFLVLDQGEGRAVLE